MVKFNESAKQWGRHPEKRKEVVELIFNYFGKLVTRKQLMSLVNADKLKFNDITFILITKHFRENTSRAHYDLSSLFAEDTEVATIENTIVDENRVQ